MLKLDRRSLRSRGLVWPGLVLAVGLHHALVWAWASWREPVAWPDLLNRWDAAHYSLLITMGYQGPHWAFFPLYPLLVRGWATALGLLAQPQVAGTILASLFFLAWVGWSVGWVGRSITTPAPSPAASPAAGSADIPGVIDAEQTDPASDRPSSPAPGLFLPETTWGWLFFLYSPSSYTFHSHHTEALFLLLSYGAFWLASRRQALPAGLLAGLSALTRNQGYLVILGTLLLLAEAETNPRSPTQNISQNPWQKIGKNTWKNIAIAASLSVALALLFPVYQYVMTGSPWESIAAQAHWSHATSLLSVLQTFWFGNPWQNTELGSLIHHGVYFLLAAGVVRLWRSSRALSLYCGLSLALLPLQGELINVFRFGAVLFPLWFLWGDRLGRAPAWQRWPILILWIALNHLVTRNYAIGGWAY